MSDNDLKNKIESVLFSTGRRLSLQELSSLCREVDIEKIKQALNALKQELDAKDSSIVLNEEGEFFKLSVRDKYLSIVRKVVKKTELTKSVLETLAIVAFKNPVLQSKVIAIRTNKAYDHLNNLEELGYITREKSGRTKLIKVAKKFFEYFDVPEEKLKERFGNVEAIEQAITKKELEPQQSDEKREFSANSKASSEKVVCVEPYTEKVGELEVYITDDSVSKSKKNELQKKETHNKPVSEKQSETAKAKEQDQKSEGFFSSTVPASIEQKVDERVNKLVHGEEDFDEKSDI